MELRLVFKSFEMSLAGLATCPDKEHIVDES